jgi:hypothetical protein
MGKSFAISFLSTHSCSSVSSLNIQSRRERHESALLNVYDAMMNATFFLSTVVGCMFFQAHMGAFNLITVEKYLAYAVPWLSSCCTHGNGTVNLLISVL